MEKTILMLVAGFLVIFGVIYAVNIENEVEKKHENHENLISEEEENDENSIEKGNDLYNKEVEKIDDQKEEDQDKEDNQIKDSEKENNQGEEEKGDTQIKEETEISFIDCLAEAGVVIYGSEWCPACTALVESLGGYEKVDPIYVECTIEEERCAKEMKTEFVPEIQIKGEFFKSGVIPPEVIGNKVGCEL